MDQYSNSFPKLKTHRPTFGFSLFNEITHITNLICVLIFHRKIKNFNLRTAALTIIYKCIINQYY